MAFSGEPRERANVASRHRLPLILSTVAIATAAVAIAVALLRDPLGSGIMGYDLTSPQQALSSVLDIRLNQDFRAMIELEQARGAKRLRERRDSIKVHKESNYEGKKILFISYQENGITKHDIESFEKDADSGLWFPTYVSTYSMSDSDLESAIKQWQAKSGTVEPADE